MEQLLGKLSSYNLFNFLFPGTVFSVAAERMGVLFAPSDKVLERLFWYYVVGFVLSRIGSVVIEPVLKATRAVSYSDYGKFLEASKIDPKLEVMVEVSNTFRTLVALFITLIGSTIVFTLANALHISVRMRELTLAGAVGLLFLLSFRKQVGFIKKRVRYFAGGPEHVDR